MHTAFMAHSNRIPFFYVLTWVLVFLAASPLRAAKRSTSDDIQDLLQRQVAWDKIVPGGKNPAGLQFQFFKIDETTHDGKHELRYRAYVLGAPTNKKYALGVWKIGSELHMLHGDVYVNNKGLLMTQKPRPEEEDADFLGDDELDLTMEAARGEPVRFALVSSDKKLFIPGTVVPYPVEDAGNGCQLEVRLAMPDAKAVLVYADGLPPNTEVPFQTLSAGQPGTGVFNVDAQGNAVTPYASQDDSGAEGPLKLTLSAKQCSASVEIVWGEGSYAPL